MKASRIIGLTIIILAIAGAGFMYWYLAWRTPVPEVSLSVSKPEKVQVGEPFTLTVSYRNDSEQILRNSKLVLVLPSGISALGQPPERRVVEENQGDLEPGLGNLGTFRFVATGEPRTLAQFEARLRYSVTDDSGSQIETKIVVDVAVGDTAAGMALRVPQQVVAGEPFTVYADYRNDSRETLKGAKLKLSHPGTFRLDSVEPEADNLAPESVTWDLGALTPSATGTIALVGTAAPGITSLDLAFVMEAQFDGRAYPVVKQAANIRISPSLLSLEIFLNNKTDYVANVGDYLNYELKYKNNAEVPLRNASLEAVLLGSLFDIRTVVPRDGGVLNSLTNTLTWSAANAEKLVVLDPGEEGSVVFTVQVRSDLVLRRLSDTHFKLSVKGGIYSPTVFPGAAGTRTASAARMETKVAGKIELQALALFYDAASGVVNGGSYPPHADKATQFTVHWKIKNYWNDASNIRVSAKLAPGVRFVGVVKNTAGSKPVFDAASGEVGWELPRLRATEGVLSAMPEAIFQIEITPGINQIGHILPLIGESSLAARDDFTGLTIGSKAAAKGTELRDDPKASSIGNGAVLP